MKTAFRLWVLVLLLVLTVLFAWWSLSSSGKLHVLEWTYYKDERFWSDFKKKYGDVEWKFGQSDADLYGELKAGFPADVVHPYTSWLKIYVDEGLVEEIDVTKLANWDKIPESLKAIGRFNGKQYFIPWDWGFSSILYRTDKVKGEIDSWAALLDPRYKGHISMFDDGPSAVAVSSYIHNYDETNITTEQLEAIKAEWIKQRELNLFYWGEESEFTPKMAGEHPDVWVAYAWPSAYVALKRAGELVAYADPKEGRASWVGVYGILKGTKNRELALKFIDEKLSNETAKTVVEEYSYGVANQEVMNSITDPMLKQALDPSMLQRSKFTPELTAEQRNAWTEMWTQVK